MTDSRSLDDLNPKFRPKAQAFLDECSHQGMPVRVTFTLRSIDTQNDLYAQGRTKPGKIVTNARGGYSFHNYGLALDGVPEELLKLPDWGDNPKDQARANELWAKYGAIARQCGLRWGGDFKSIKDRPHVEWSGDLTLADLRAGKRP